MALELPEPVREELADWQAQVVDGMGGLRAVSREALHVTLCFLGAVAAGRVGAVAEACAVVRGRSAGRLSVSDPLWLPRRRPRVLAVGLEDQLGELAGLQAELSAALVAAGVFRAEKRSFLPHVTVARVRSGGRPRVRPREIDGPDAGVFNAEQVTLYRSHLGGGPARYESLRRIPLSRR